jgi:excisionase family DNA binding protein
VPVAIDKRLLDAKGAARYLSISVSKLYYLMQEERIKSIKFGKKRLFSVYALDEFADKLEAENNGT